MPRQLTKNQYREAVQKLHIRCDYNYTSRSSAMFHCCYHEDWSPSLSISFSKGIYHCFQCSRGGSINKLCQDIAGKNIEQVLGISEDIGSLYQTSNRKVPIYNNETKIIPKPIDIRGVLVSWRKSARAQEYVARRGITESIADSLKFQYVTEARINGTLFKDRVCIPIYDDLGNMINIEGRAVDPKDTTKCLYPAGSIKPIFEWYTLNKQEPLYLFEGLIKMLVARTDSFFANSSTTFGSKISDYHIEQLNMFETIIHCPDRDEAGRLQSSKLKKVYKGKLHVWLLNDYRIKDVDEIPTHLKMTMKEYREQIGFITDISYI